jgi:2-polyprenyl-3-methyl-5-hydroxy-6-metoxy-1,4-benzoquinol methylase
MASIQDERGYNQGFAPTPALKLRTRRRAEWISAEIPVHPSTMVLEIGCGTGELAKAIGEKTHGQVIATDLSPKFIEIAQAENQLPNVTFRVVNFKEDTIPERFDRIVGNGILHHLYYSIDSSLERLFELLKPGGKILFFEPNLRNPYVYLIFSVPKLRQLTRLEPDEMAFTRSWIHTRLARAGFTNIDVQYRDFLMPNTPTAWIHSVASLSDRLEKMPGIQTWTQSLFITASRRQNET